jgi:hypothetical protein
MKPTLTNLLIKLNLKLAGTCNTEFGAAILLKRSLNMSWINPTLQMCVALRHWQYSIKLNDLCSFSLHFQNVFSSLVQYFESYSKKLNNEKSFLSYQKIIEWSLEPIVLNDKLHSILLLQFRRCPCHMLLWEVQVVPKVELELPVQLSL